MVTLKFQNWSLMKINNNKFAKDVSKYVIEQVDFCIQTLDNVISKSLKFKIIWTFLTIKVYTSMAFVNYFIKNFHQSNKTAEQKKLDYDKK